VKVIHDWRWSFRLFGDAIEELRIRPQGVLHVGAHHGEEVPIYLAAGFKRITLVEPDPRNCDVIAAAPWIEEPGVGIVNKACGPRGTQTFHRAAITPFSGLKQDRRQKPAGTFPVEVVPIADIQAELAVQPNVLTVDTQGTELEALVTAFLDPIDLIIIETQSDHAGAPGAYLPDLLEWCHGTGWLPRIQWKRDAAWCDLLLTPKRQHEPDASHPL
jgi:FkbM family methyltransferase